MNTDTPPGAIRPVRRPCPHCGAARDVTTAMPGDVCWCSHCDGWFIVMAAGQLVACEAPASWPKERRS